MGELCPVKVCKRKNGNTTDELGEAFQEADPVDRRVFLAISKLKKEKENKGLF